MNYFEAIPAIQVRFMSSLHGPIPARPLGQGAAAMPPPQGSTKKMCLCDLQRQKDEERRNKKKGPEGRSS